MGFVFYVGRMKENPANLMQRSLRNLFAYDFYTPKIYRNSVVLLVDRLSRLTDWLDRYVVDGFVNFLGLASLLGGETLKYGNSGKSQLYVLTITIGVILLSVWMSWSFLPNLF
jgi:NAD(P)H-quinone oxidoreductase subunit 5